MPDDPVPRVPARGGGVRRVRDGREPARGGIRQRCQQPVGSQRSWMFRRGDCLHARGPSETKRMQRAPAGGRPASPSTGSSVRPPACSSTRGRLREAERLRGIGRVLHDPEIRGRCLQVGHEVIDPRRAPSAGTRSDNRRASCCSGCCRCIPTGSRPCEVVPTRRGQGVVADGDRTARLDRGPGRRSLRPPPHRMSTFAAIARPLDLELLRGDQPGAGLPA